MKKALSLVLSLGLVASMCVGCGGSKTESSSSSQAEPVSEAADTEETAEVGGDIGEHTFSYSVAQGESTTYYKTAEKFAEMMEEASGGKIKIEVYGNCSLSGGDQTAALEMIQKGSIDMGMVTAAVCGNMIQDLRVTVIPWAFDGEAHVDAALTKGSGYYDLIDGLFAEKSMKLLGIAEHGFREIMTSKYNIETVEDLKGLKLRVLSTPVLNDFFTSLGVNTADIGPTEIYTSLQNGTIDGQENPLVYSYYSDFISVAPYVTIWKYAYDAHPFMMSTILWDSLTADEQALFIQVTDEWIPVQRQMMRDAYDEAYQLAVDEGATIIELTEEQLVPFKEAAEKTSASYIEELKTAYDLLQEAKPE